MRKFMITVAGNTYEVDVEEVTGAVPVAPAAPIAAAAPAAPVAPVAPAAPAPAPKAAVSQGEAVKAPMPGTILDLRVTSGAAVKSGDVLLVLEAMKMENEILSPCDGVVAQIVTSKGASVNSGDVLVIIA